MKPYKVNVDGEEITVIAQKIDSVLWFHHKGKTYRMEPENKKGKHGQSENIKHPEITAPMPGKILKVNCKLGDTLEEGFVAIIMEAMKMEYSLEVSVAGAVELLNCKVGDQVAQGQVLLKTKGEE